MVEPLTKETGERFEGLSPGAPELLLIVFSIVTE